MARSMASIVACSSTNLARASTVFSRSNGAAMIFAKGASLLNQTFTSLFRPSPPGTVQGLLRRAHILSAQHQRNHGTVQTQTSTTPHDQSGTQGTRHSGTGGGHHPDHQAADEDQTAVRTLR